MTDLTKLFCVSAALFRLGARARARCSGTKMHVVHTRQCRELKMIIYLSTNRRQICSGAAIGCQKVNTVGIDENLFRLVPVPRHGAQALPLELVPVPRHGVQISARVPATKRYVQTRAHAWAPCTGRSLNRSH